MAILKDFQIGVAKTDGMVNNHWNYCNSHQFSIELQQHVANYYIREEFYQADYIILVFYVCTQLVQFSKNRSEISTENT